MKSTINLGYLVFLSVVAALGGFLFGYDTAVISGTIGDTSVSVGHLATRMVCRMCIDRFYHWGAFCWYFE